ncbi:uncharacterized protein I206_101353 [Kwoniella pini CBS 10737]|uniref:Uncharacterized protein n=1 Tax=Kwoniella pini CBS 10737 TaxID=1296096 RepID=A0A1B9HWX0_9TREE|nr:uncharacterized protein I206_06679 [Kwoniella pini CBS 10737]OCF47772.1 hypothetical protein I206_06679 [Kwoniella pini CBS 10737]
MPKALPRLTPPPEGGESRDPISIALEQHLHDVRQWTEWVTNGDPRGIGTMDYGIYRTFEVWVQRKESLDVIDSILQNRMSIGYPYSQKAIILAQILPSERLIPYIKLLEPLLPPTTIKKEEEEEEEELKNNKFLKNFNPLISNLAKNLYDKAKLEELNLENLKKEKEEKLKQEEEIKKWELWCNLYGRTCKSNWLSKSQFENPQWTYWNWKEISKEDWWKGRND